ncbi:MAG TPA: transglutaminase-like domain-containing protein [Vicinamibacterales bacterium]
MNRRHFLLTTAGAAACLVPRGALANLADPADSWRTYEVTTDIDILHPDGVTRVWAPLPLPATTPFQRLLDSRSHAEGGRAEIRTLGSGTTVLAASWPAGVEPRVSLTHRIATRDLTVDFKRPARTSPADRATLAPYLRPTSLQPTDGIVGETARTITRGAGSDLEKARAIYDWVVDNTFRDPTVQGCGLGDIRFMLESGDLGGKCADINALYAGLARAAGLPARDVYGVRVGPSRRGFKSLGISTSDATRAQHCRAEVYLRPYGWVPVDPADVGKVALEEPPGHLSPESEPVQRARAMLFGSWEMNWMAYNYSHNVQLPGAQHVGDLGFLLYPQCETADGLIDSLAPDQFRYRITARQV